MTDIRSMLPEELEQAFKDMGQPKYRAGQVFDWLTRGVSSFDEMTNLPKGLREELKNEYVIPMLTCLKK